VARLSNGSAARRMLGRMENTESGSSFFTKAIAAVVLLVAAWILIKVVIGIVSAVFWTGLTIVAILAVLWAFFTLRS
jgi:hypothetical protein